MATPKILFTIEQPHGLGELYFCWQKGASRSLIATTGTDSTIAIYDRHAQLQERLKLPGLCSGMEWDSDGDLLAAITPSSHAVLLWECHANKRVTVETGLKETPACIAWAVSEPLLAIGTHRGSVVLYSHHTTKRIPVIGKHSKKITCAAWNSDNILALASEDKTLSINNSDGDTLRIISLRDLPNELQFSEMKTDERIAGENTISLVVGKRTLYLYNILDPDNPIELAFQQKYGSIISYKWYGDGYILIGFSAGFLIAISTHIKEVGQELFQVKNHNNLTDIAMCNSLGQAATCGDNTLKLNSIWDKAAIVGSVSPAGGAEHCAWSNDGQLLAVAGRSYLHVYVCSLPTLHAAHDARALTLTSLNQATLYQCIGLGESGGISKEAQALSSYLLPAEPTLLSLGAGHVCCARGNAAWFLPLVAPALPSPTAHRVYPATVTKLVAASDYVAAMFQGKLMLHMFEQPDPLRVDKESKMFPEPPMQEDTITDVNITNDFLIFITNLGHLQYFALEEWRVAVRYKHWCGLSGLYCDPAATRVVLLDAKHKAHVYNPIHDEIVIIDDLPSPCRGVIWDVCVTERNVLCAFSDTIISTYYYCGKSVTGAHTQLVDSSPVPADQTPLLMYRGDVYTYCKGGTMSKWTLQSHATAGVSGGAGGGGDDAEACQKRHLQKLLGLRHFQDAWPLCEALDQEDHWRHLGEAAIQSLDVEFAIRVYIELSDVAMVWSLRDASEVEDTATLCGLLCVCLGRLEAGAQWLECGGSSGARRRALDLRAAALQWGRAADLARAVDPRQLPLLNKEHAKQLEFTGDYHDALSNYEKSIIEDENSMENFNIKQHNEECLAGIARTSIKCGDIVRSMSIVAKLGENPKLMKECAQLMEEGKHYSQAAAFYDQAGDTDKAAYLYIKLKSWLKVEALLPKITSPKIHIQYAKAKESEGRYAEALKSYIRAKDFDAAVRLNLDHLDDPDSAVEIVQETKSIPGAKMVANYFQRLNDYTTAIKFLIMSLCYDEAFQLARKHNKLQLYGEILINVTSQTRPDDFKSLALHFESEKNHLLAGKFYFHAKEYSKAMSHLLKVGDSKLEQENEAITLAIDTVASSNDEKLSKRLVEFLLGETDGLPKEPKYLFRLYMARKQFPEAAKTAVIIANQEQVSGNYRTAHDVLLSMVQELRGASLPVPADMRAALARLHAYILVRLHVKRGDHLKCARMLVRVANDISFFPTHVVPILTSTVIECQRAGLKRWAHTFARALMRPEYRSKIDAKYVKKIESAVRHAPRTTDTDAEPTSACPQCGHQVPITELLCASCNITIPFCIATGCHIVKGDLTACPECDFPAIRSEFLIIAEEEGRCPMCWENIDYRRLVNIENISPYLQHSNTDEANQ